MPDPEQLLAAIRLAKNHYFKKTMDKRGRFIYEYSLSQKKKLPRYNMLRHAGTVYAMLQTAELTRDSGLLGLARQGLKFLIDHIRTVHIDGREFSALIDSNSLKLGGNALAIIALAKYCEVTQKKTYVPLMQALAGWMIYQQRDDGWFPVHKMTHTPLQATDFVSGYYPGETVLALVRLYGLDRNDQWLSAAQKGAEYIIHVRDKHKIIADHWFMYALNDLYRCGPNRDYIDHSLKMAKKICRSQIRNHPKKAEWNGGYFVGSLPPRSTPAACRSEGLGAACLLLRDHGDSSDRQALESIQQAIHAGIEFQLQMQVKGDIKHSRKWLGGFMESLEKDTIRIDYTQHNISGLILYHQILTGEFSGPGRRRRDPPGV